MTFDEMLEQVITLLKRQGRVSYNSIPECRISGGIMSCIPSTWQSGRNKW
jgi:hypothetical protein